MRTIGMWLEYRCVEIVVRGLLVSLATLVATTASAKAEVCVFPDYEETCSGDECELDFELDNSDTSHIQSDVLLDERRARARANGGLANTNVAIAEVGVRFRVAVEMEADLRVEGSYSGELDGGIGEAFANFRIGLILRDLDEGTVLIDQALEAQEVDTTTLDVEGDVAGEITQHLLKDTNYALSLRLRAASRGQAIAHSNFSGGTGGVAFERFSIAGVSREADTDGDALPDMWESEGVRDCDDELVLNLPALGADPNRQDLFVEVDWLQGSPPSKPTIAAVKSAFLSAPEDAGGSNDSGQSGIKLHVDTGGLYDPARREAFNAPLGSCGDGIDNNDGDGKDAADPDCRIGDDLGGGEMIPLSEVPNYDDQVSTSGTVPGVGGDSNDDGKSDFFELKRNFFDPARRFAFRYVIFTKATDFDSDPSTPCVARDDDDPECFQFAGQTRGVNIVIVNDQPVTLMHELGHSLGLGHGGPTFFTTQSPPQFDINCKPNYLSIMNYSLSTAAAGGILQRSQDLDGDGRDDTGQDLNGDGLNEGRILDFSPPRFPVLVDGDIQFDRSIIDSLPTIDESCLDSTQALDPSDNFNYVPFTDSQGNTDEAPVDAPIDWAGPGVAPPNEQCIQANVNLFVAACANNPKHFALMSGQILGGANDWRNIVFSARVRGDGDASEADIVEPTISEIEAAGRQRDLADLTITQTITPAPAVAGQPLTITLTIENLGPNHVSAAEVVNQVPSDIEVIGLDENCVEDPENTVTCQHGDFWPGDQRSFDIEGRLRADLECAGRQFLEMNNSAQVENVYGLDPQTDNNGTRGSFEILCIRYELPAKMVCGEQPDRQRLGLLAGRYGTTVNIHNPNDEQVTFFAKLAPAPVTGGHHELPRSLPIELHKLGYDQSLAIDCDQVRDELFDGALPEDLVDGYLVVQSPRRLDVDAVYTTAGLETAAQLGLGSADVERVRSRDRARLKRPLPDLRVQLACDTPAPGGAGSPRFADVTIANQGKGDADPFRLRLQFGEHAVGFLERPLVESGQQIALSLPIPDSCGPDCRVTAVADADGIVDESNEHNNLARRMCTISPG